MLLRRALADFALAFPLSFLAFVHALPHRYFARLDWFCSPAGLRQHHLEPAGQKVYDRHVIVSARAHGAHLHMHLDLRAQLRLRQDVALEVPILALNLKLLFYFLVRQGLVKTGLGHLVKRGIVAFALDAYLLCLIREGRFREQPFGNNEVLRSFVEDLLDLDISSGFFADCPGIGVHGQDRVGRRDGVVTAA